MAANTIATDFLKYVSNYNKGTNDSHESRMTRHGMLKAHLADTRLVGAGAGVVSSEEAANIQELGYSPNGASISVINKDDVTISTSSFTDCTASSDPNDTATVDVSYSTLSFDLFIPENQYNFNHVSLGQAMDRAMFERTRAVVNSLEDLSILNVETGRNQVQSETMGGFFTDSTDDSYTYADADRSDFYNNAGSLYQKFDTNVDRYRVIANAEHWPAVVNPTFAQGVGNATNTQWQFTGAPSVDIDEFGFPMAAWDFYNSNRLSNAGGVAGAKDTTYIFPIGTTGLFSSVDPRFTQGNPEGIPNTVTKFKTSLPGLDPSLEFGVRITQSCTNGVDGWSWQFEGKFAFLTKYNSAPATEVGLINRFERV